MSLTISRFSKTATSDTCGMTEPQRAWRSSNRKTFGGARFATIYQTNEAGGVTSVDVSRISEVESVPHPV